MGSEDYTFRMFLADFWELLSGKRLRFVFFSGLRSASSLIKFLTLALIGYLVDTLVSGDATLRSIGLIALGIGALESFRTVLRFYAKWYMQLIGAEVRQSTRLRAVNSYVAHVNLKDSTMNSGAVLEHINQGSDKLFEGIKLFSNKGIEMLTNIAGAALLLVAISPLNYGLFCAAYFGVYLGLQFYFNRKLHELGVLHNAAKAQLSGKHQEAIAQASAIQALGAAGRITSHLSHAERAYFESWKKLKKFGYTRSIFTKSLAGIGYALFILLLGLQALSGVLSVGLIVVYSQYFARFREGILDITDVLPDFVDVQSALARFLPILNLQSDRAFGHAAFPCDWKAIRFEAVSFSYGSRKVLDNVSFELKRGKHLALVGMTGAGKSTIVKLLLGLLVPSHGKITVDSVPYTHYSLSSLREQIKIVLQEPELFHMTLRDNIELVSGTLDDVRMKQILKSSCLDTFVPRLPSKLTTVVGERGHHLSGGERQRVGVARALASGGSLLILDEATSNLDPATEKRLLARVSSLGVTQLSIAHRPSVVKLADNVIVLSHGNVVATGSYATISSHAAFKTVFGKQQKDN